MQLEPAHTQQHKTMLHRMRQCMLNLREVTPTAVKLKKIINFNYQTSSVG